MEHRPEDELKHAFLELLAAIERNADKSFEQSGHIDGGIYANPQWTVVRLAARSFSLYRNVLRLLSVHCAEEAAILSRSMMSDSLTLAYLLANRNRLPQLAVQIEHRSLTQQLALQTAWEHTDAGNGNDINKALREVMDASFQQLHDYRRSIGMTGKIPGVPDEREMARDLGRKDYSYYWDWACNAVHTTSDSLNSRVMPLGERFAITLETPRFGPWSNVAMMAGHIFPVGHHAACVLLDFPTADEVRSFGEHVDQKLLALRQEWERSQDRGDDT